MILTIYLKDPPYKMAVEATPVRINELQAAVHETVGTHLFGSYTVTEITSGMAIARGDSEEHVVRKSKKLVNQCTSQQIQASLGDALNLASNVEEFIAMTPTDAVKRAK